MIEDLGKLFDTIINYPDHTCRYVAVSSILPRAKDYWTTIMKTKRFNKEIKENEDIIGMHYLRTWRPFSRKNLPQRFMYKLDGIHPSGKGANRFSQYLAKQMAITRKEMSIPRSSRPASQTIVTKKPWGGYGYKGERRRHKILFRPPGDFPPEPTYGSGEKDIHKPKASTILRKNTASAIKHMRASLTREGKIAAKPKKQKKNFTLKMKKQLVKAVKKLETRSHIHFIRSEEDFRSEKPQFRQKLDPSGLFV